MAGPIREFFANIKMRQQMIAAVMSESDLGRLQAGMQVRNFENTHPESLAFAANVEPGTFDSGVYVAALAHVGMPEAQAIVEHTTKFGALGDGTFLAMLQQMMQKLLAGLSDPANQQKIMDAIKFLMTIFALFGPK